MVQLAAPPAGPFPSYNDTPHPFGEVKSQHRFAAGNAGKNLLAVTQGNKNAPCQIIFLKRALHIQEQSIMLLKPLHPKAHSQPSSA